MSKIRIMFFVAIIGLIANYNNSCFAFDDGDFQFWNSESLSWKVDENYNLGLEEEFRYGDNASNFYYQHSDLSLTYSGFADWLDTTVGYRQIFEEKNSDWKQENRPHLGATASWMWGELALSNRARIEYRNREDAENLWQYRNKLTIKLPVKFTSYEIQPYIADEIFYDFDEETLGRNRAYVGFSLKLLKNLKAEIYYLLQSSEKGKDWTEYNVLGTKLKVSF